MKTIKSDQSGVAHVVPVLIIVVIAVVGFVGWRVWASQASKKNSTQSPAASKESSSQTSGVSKISVKEAGAKILGNGYADPTVVPTESGYRMYVNRQSGGPGGYLTFTSPDGITWTKEHDIIISGVATGRAVVLQTGGIRFYYPGMQPINPADPPADMFSSFSSDGVTFKKDPGIAITGRSKDYYVEGPTVFQLPDKTWRMYFNENSVAAGNRRDGEIWGASSPDGITWTRDDKVTLKDEQPAATGPGSSPWQQALHPFVLSNPKGGYIMFYNTHSELYAATSTDGMTWNKIGKIGVHGADIDGYFQADGTIRVYYGDYTPQTGGLVYTAVLKVD